MNNIAKAKEPWLAILFNMIFLGLGHIYARRKIRAFIIIGILIILLCLGLFEIYILINPEAVITKFLVIIGIAFIVIKNLFSLSVFIDGYLCIRKYNITNGVKQSNIAFRTLSIIGCIVLFFTGGIQTPIALYIRNSVAQAFKVPAGTMKPTLQERDRIIVNKRAYIKTTPQRGDVIIFKYPQDRKKIFVKRVVGLPGEILEIKDGKIIINGKEIKSKFYYYNRGEYGKEGQRVEIPPNNYYVLGDNSASSSDSRYFGFVSSKDIIGKAIKIYWPLDRSGKVE